ncbi:MAG: carboxymuconolactone decarboxylase family protein [Planctomycetota bacterium]
MLKYMIPCVALAGSVIAASAIAGGTGVESKGSGMTQMEADTTGATSRGFAIHSIESAPAQTKEVLEWYNQIFQFVPHLAGIMAESPALSRSYWQLQKNLQESGSLTQAENNVVQMAVAVENECQYCVAGHIMAGGMFFGASPEEINALKTASELPTPKLDALRDFSLAVYESKGRVSDADLRRFYAAGYTRTQALDVVANIASKIMSNYTNQIALTPMDEVLKPLAEGLPFEEDRKLVKD